jgi:uncharacterized membrane protein
MVFGDRTGLALFLGALCLFGLAFRVDILINDTQTTLNTLYNLGNGHLAFVEAPYGDATTPGDHLVDGRRYGRNYGQAAFALPLQFAFRLASLLVPVQVVVVACWVAVTAGFLACVRSLTGRRRLVTAGAVATAVLVVGSLLVLPPTWKGDPTVFALVASTAVAGGFCAVFVYRLLAETYSRRVGLLCGVGTVLAIPTGLWSVLPKRHALVSALVLGSLYAFARSRSTAVSTTDARRARAVAYAFVGLLSWIHAAEAAGLAVLLVLVDLPTARSNDLRTLAVVAGTFLLAATPTLLTNLAISGNPIEPPRLLPEFAPEGEADDGTTMGGGGGGSSNPVVLLVMRYVRGLSVFGDLPRVQHVLLWSGTSGQTTVVPPFGPGTNLSVFESAPVLGALGAAVGAGLRRVRDGGPRALPVPNATVWYALLASLGYVLLFIPSLPLRIQLTSRYLLPVFPLLLVACAAVGVNRDAVTSHTRALGVIYAFAVVTVSVALPVLGFVLDLDLGGLFLIHAAVNLLAWGMLVAVSVRAGLRDRGDRVLAAAIGLAAGVGTALVLDIWFVYLHYGPSLLPSVEAVTRWAWMALVFH